MQTTLKISALEEYAQRQEKTDADEATLAMGMVAGLKRSMRPDFDYDEALIEASFKIQELLKTVQKPAEPLEYAIGFFSGIVFTSTNDVFEAQAAGYQEHQALRTMLESGHL